MRQLVAWSLVAGLGCAGSFLSGCGEDERPPAAEDTFIPEDDDGDRPGRPVRPEGDDDSADDDLGDDDSADDDESPAQMEAGTASPPDPGRDAGTDAGPTTPTNCGDLVCRGHGACAIVNGFAACICDEGYIAEGEEDDFECVVDRSCKRLRPLEPFCRQIIGGPPAVATFFAVDYCAGTAVLPEDLGDLDEAFEISENGQDILQNEESVAAVIERDVESYVAIAIDVSKSVTGVEGDTEKQEALAALVGEIRQFVASLKSPRNQPPVTVSILVFGRFAEEYVPFTTDLDRVDAALQTIEDDPQSVVQLVGGDGTALYDAVKLGIDTVERIQQLRFLVTDAGVLTTGTLVVITDGRDSSNAELDDQRVEDTLVNLVSMGISNDIDDEDLGLIGRDGSFLTPEREDWAAAFDEIAQRVDEYPDRAYLLAYCSSATTGELNVSVGLRGEPAETMAGCNVSASAFSDDPADVCDLALFENVCEVSECGEMFACGGCSPSQCCAAGACQAPSPTEKCLDQDALCAPAGLVCRDVEDPPEDAEEEDKFVCAPAREVDDECDPNDDECARGSYCHEDDKVCVPSELQTGDRCGNADRHSGHQCPELNCAQKRDDNPTDPYLCRREARVFERCAGNTADAVCEPGASCQGQLCEAQNLWPCTKDEDCLSGYCNEDTDLCYDLGVCPFSWDAKVIQ